ncbi:hypothetical protein O3S80_42800 [Streptomyces sp. Lzd4kr]|nr:hypothetical protein [Streptomyces sp. Lzd4kr]
MPDPTTLPEPFETAAQAFKALLDTLGAGRHHLVCSAHTDQGSFASVSTTVDRAPDDQDLMEADGEGSLMFCHLLAQTSLGYRDAAIFTRTYASEDRAVLRGWRVTAGWPEPMEAADVFAAYCTDLATGDPIPPEPGTDYQAGILLAPNRPGSSA